MQSSDKSHALFMIARGEHLYNDYVILSKDRVRGAAQEIDRLNELARELAHDVIGCNNGLRYHKKKLLPPMLVAHAEQVLEKL